jgi:hypothetical protein
MEIELTSRRDDQTWTWRAAGARQPRGVVADAMLPGGSKVGNVLRVEAEIELEGINIVSVLPSRGRNELTDRIEIIAPAPPVEPVTTSLVARGPSRGRRPSGDFDRDRPDRRGESRRPSSPRRDGAAGGERSGAGERASGDRTARDGRPRPDGGAATRSGRPSRPRTDGPPRDAADTASGRPRTERPSRPRPDASGASGASGARPRPEGTPARPNRARPPRFVPHTVHRDLLFGELPAEQRAIAEQLAAGGLPAMRRALAEEQASARAAGRPPVGGEAMIALAEELLPRVHEADWLDRAESAVGQLETISLRDLRATVAAAAPRDDAGRELLLQLRAAYDERITKLRTTWEQEIRHALEEGRVLQALRLSARLPEPSARFPAALVQPLAEAASAALNDKVPPERWLALLEAATAAPIRRIVKPEGVPADESGTVRQAATVAAGSIPALAALVGLSMPPPPRPVARTPNAGGPGRPVRGPRRDTRPVPPPPTGTELPRPAEEEGSTLPTETSETTETTETLSAPAPEAELAPVEAEGPDTSATPAPDAAEADSAPQAPIDATPALSVTEEPPVATPGPAASAPESSTSDEAGGLLGVVGDDVVESTAVEAPVGSPVIDTALDEPAVDDAVRDQPLEESAGQVEES